MTLTAYGPTFRDDVESGFRRSLDTAEDVRALVALISEDDVFTTTIEGAHAALDVHVRDEYGYLFSNGPETIGAYSSGVPSSPEITQSEIGFPAGSGVPLDVFTHALIEFVETGTLPKSIRWNQQGDPFPDTA